MHPDEFMDLSLCLAEGKLMQHQPRGAEVRTQRFAKGLLGRTRPGCVIWGTADTSMYALSFSTDSVAFSRSNTVDFENCQLSALNIDLLCIERQIRSISNHSLHSLPTQDVEEKLP